MKFRPDVKRSLQL